MFKYQINLKKTAQKQLKSLPEQIGNRIFAKIDDLAIDPRPSGCKKLKGSDNLWRIRVADYRIIYNIYDQELIIYVLKVGHRR
jgi:mRNA interferase RelE/StbE